MHENSKRLGSAAQTVWLLVLIKAVYLLSLWGALVAWSPSGPEDEFRAKDASHYLHLSQTGYSVGDRSVAFYPLWPALIRWFSIFTGGSHLASGLVLANAFSVCAMLLFFRMVRRRFGDSAAWWSLLFTLLFPGAIFFQLVYTEALFLLLLMLLCYGLERGRHGVAIAAGFLLPLTKAIGLFCVIPVGYQVCAASPAVRRWLAMHAARLPVFRTTSSTAERAQGAGTLPALDPIQPTTGSGVWLLLSPLLGWTTYLHLMWTWTGNPLAGFEAQNAWGVQSIGNLFDLPKFVSGFSDPNALHSYRGSALDRLGFVALVGFLPLIWKLDKQWFLWALVLGVIPAVSGTFTSYTRFEAVVFPLFAALGVFLGRREWRSLRWAGIAACASAHAFLLWRFVTHGWVG